MENYNNSLFSVKIDKKLEFPRSDLVLEETLGEGEFGCVVCPGI